MTISIIALFLISLLLLTTIFHKKFSKKLHRIFLVLEILFLNLVITIGLCLGFFGVGGMGVTNWDCDNLPGRYEIWRSSARNIQLVLANENGVSASEVVPTYVFEVGYTHDYIFAKQANVPENDNKRIDKSVPNFYIVAVATGEVFGPYNETEFSEYAQQLGVEEPICWMSLNTLRKTPCVTDR